MRCKAETREETNGRKLLTPPPVQVYPTETSFQKVAVIGQEFLPVADVETSSA
jgi:hypothetical protein